MARVTEKKVSDFFLSSFRACSAGRKSTDGVPYLETEKQAQERSTDLL